MVHITKSDFFSAVLAKMNEYIIEIKRLQYLIHQYSIHIEHIRKCETIVNTLNNFYQSDDYISFDTYLKKVVELDVHIHNYQNSNILTIFCYMHIDPLYRIMEHITKFSACPEFFSEVLAKMNEYIIEIKRKVD
jgi:hypothetical protein